MKFWNFRKAGVKNEAGRPAGAGAAVPDGVLDIDGEIVAEEDWFRPDSTCVAKNFRAELKQYGNVTVRINSPGGDVMAGADIYSALKEHSLNGKGQVTVVIAALAASAASVIAMAGDRVLISPTAYMMIHNPWTGAVGDAREMRKTARTLDSITEGLINAYQARTGKGRDELKRMLEAETWMSAYTCVENGFADEVIGAEAGSARAVACLMSGKSHGAMEVAARIRGEEEIETEREEDPKDPETEPEEEPREDLLDKDEETEPDEDPEEGGDPESDPEEDPEEEPEDPEETEEDLLDKDEETEEPEEEPKNPEETEEPEDDTEEEEEEERAKAATRLRAAALALAEECLESSYEEGRN